MLFKLFLRLIFQSFIKDLFYIFSFTFELDSYFNWLLILLTNLFIIKVNLYYLIYF